MLLSLAFIDYRLFLIQAIKKGAAVINREYPLMLRIIAALLSVCILLVLPGCGQKAKVEVSKSGKTVHYTMRQIRSSGKWGFYVMTPHRNGESTFTPLLTDVEGTALDGSGGQGLGSDDETKFFWWCDYSIKDKKIRHKNLIPKVSESHPLVYIQDDDDDMPASYNLDVYRDLGPTIGVKVGVNDAQNGIYMMPGSGAYNTRSSVYNALRQLKLDDSDSVTISAISSGTRLQGVDQSIIQSVDTELNTLMCFNEARNKLFRIKISHGTQTEYMDVRADTEVYKYLQSIDLGPKLHSTDNGYAIVPLPKDMMHGRYYVINGQGVFYY